MTTTNKNQCVVCGRRIYKSSYLRCCRCAKLPYRYFSRGRQEPRPDVEERVSYYRERAAKRLPLFDPPYYG